MTHGVCEFLWLKNLIQELRITISGSISLLCDNNVTTNIAYNLVQHDQPKHIKVDRCFIKKQN